MLARDMLRLLNAVGVERAHMVGHSMGGDVAMSCAVMQPERALSLVSIGSAGLANPALALTLHAAQTESGGRAEYQTVSKRRFSRRGAW